MRYIAIVVLAAIIVFVLSGCQTLLQNPPPLPPPGPSATLNLDRALLTLCQDSAVLASGKEADVITWGLDMKGKLVECSKNHKALVDSLNSIK